MKKGGERMSKNKEFTNTQQIARAHEQRSMALSFLYEGRVDHTRWSPEVAAGLGKSLTEMAITDFGKAEAFAEKAVNWAQNSITRLQLATKQK